MEDQLLKYKGYFGELSVDLDAEVIRGSVTNTQEPVTFQGRTVVQAMLAFRDAVDDYLALRSWYGQQPEKPTDQVEKTITMLEVACRAALIFCPPYYSISRGEWLKLTGTSEVSSAVLRPILMRALEQAKRLHDPRKEV